MLKYLFTATFSDGSVIKQTQEDTSTRRAGGSAFTDVCMAQEDGLKLVKFELEGNGETWGVDLTDGHFEHNGRAFKAIKGDFPEHRIIYFRETQQHLTMGMDGSDPKHAGSSTVYLLGWQCTYEDRNYQRVLEID